MAHHLVLSAAIIAVLLLAPRAASQGYPWSTCGTTGNFAAKSKYLANLDVVTATLPKNASSSPDLFATAEVGAIPDQVTALGLCRGDTNSTACRSCLVQAFSGLSKACGNSKDAAIFFDLCMLYYSNLQFLSTSDFGQTLLYEVSNGNNITSEPARFNRVVAELLNATADYAAYNSTRLYASGEADFDQEFPKVYSWAQCMPDLTPARCRECLAVIVAQSLGLFTNSIGARALGVRCSYRYETAPFMDGPMMVRLARAGPSTSSGAPAAAVPAVNETPVAAAGRGNKHRKMLIVLLCVPISLFCCMLLGCLLLIKRLRKGAGKKLAQLRVRSRNSSKTEEALKLWKIEESCSDFRLYDFADLAAATDNFSEETRLGRGGFGPVYKGRLPDGTEVAVKRLAAQSGQGLKEFKNEIQLIAKLQHTNLVRLMGCCVQEEEKILVYEYMPYRSLDFFIFDKETSLSLDWKKRRHIIEGIAQGLLYLHKHSRLRIIHRDLKASNILLDIDINPKISDFGMARIFASNMTEANTNRVVGTYGYMAPEYASEGIFSVKSDVFSFGVLLLEIVSGKRNGGNQRYGDFINLLGYAWQLWTEGRGFELIDPTLGKCNEMASIMRCIKVALLCVQDNAMDRPTMTDVIAMLGNDGLPLSDPRQPPYFHLRVSDDNDGLEARTQQFNGWCSTNYVTITTIEEGR